MLIEFSCPVCQAALAINKQTVGGQVNCPKCQKLILLPSESPLPRHDPDRVPFAQDQSYSVAEVTRAICISAEPYRRDLETKSNLLNDAVEMVKIRNERIKEVETLMLKTQAELWALEAEIGDLEQEWTQDRESAKRLRLELEENLQLLRDRLEQERESHRQTLLEREAEWRAAEEKKRAGLEKKLNKIQEQLDASDAKRMDALKAQQALTEQSLASEEEIRQLKQDLQKALARLEEIHPD